MAGIPIFTRNITGNAIASYDWLDIISGCGYKRFYGCACSIPTAAYFLTSKLIDAAPLLKTENTGGAGYTTLIDLDFDIIIKSPTIVSGVAYVNLTTKGTTAGDTFHKVVVNVCHVDAGTSETIIGTVTGPEHHTTGVPEYARECFKIALSNKKFAIGETLRITIQVQGHHTAGSGTVTLYFDPPTRLTFTDTPTSTTIGTDLIIDVPFKIDIS